MQEVTCLKCGWVSFEITEDQVDDVTRYKKCSRCGGSYKNFRDAREGDAPDGVTINGILARGN